MFTILGKYFSIPVDKEASWFLVNVAILGGHWLNKIHSEVSTKTKHLLDIWIGWFPIFLGPLGPSNPVDDLFIVEACRSMSNFDSPPKFLSSFCHARLPNKRVILFQILQRKNLWENFVVYATDSQKITTGTPETGDRTCLSSFSWTSS